MGRRALRQIDTAIDLTGFYLDWVELPEPFSANRLFGRSAPFEVEIGTGKGLFLSQAAAAHPDRDYLGVEISQRYARFSAARLAKQQQRNAKVLRGDAIRLIAQCLPNEVAAAVHVYFPDPWWKQRHKKRRVMSSTFVVEVERVLQAGGSLHFWTDVQEYFQTTLELIRSHTSLLGPFPIAEQPAVHDLDYRTHFERRMRQHSQAVFRGEFRRPAGAPVAVSGS